MNYSKKFFLSSVITVFTIFILPGGPQTFLI